MTEADAFVARDRRSIRLSGYDYGRAGAYFITVCTQDRAERFGTIAGGEMRPNDAGRMVQDVWNGIPSHYPGVDIDAFVVMPDHVHGIIVLVGATPRGCPTPRGCQTSDAPPYACPIAVGRAQGPAYPIGRAQGPAPTEPTRPARTERLSLPDVVHRFKSLTTARYRDGVKQHGWPAFDGHLWQRNYHEHIIRDDAELLRIQRYIVHNPAHEHRGMVSMDEGRSL